MTEWSEARGRWRSQWSGRAAHPSELAFQLLRSQSGLGRSGYWVHPVADEAPELDAWRTLWEAATHAERNDLAAAFVRAIAQIESDPASAAEACAQLARSAAPTWITPRCADACAELSGSAYVSMPSAMPGSRCSVSMRALRLPTTLVRMPRSTPSRFAGSRRRKVIRRHLCLPVILRLIASECSAAGSFARLPMRKARAFDVTRKKYKEWPPMW